MLAAYIARRFLLTLPAMLAMSVIVFLMIRLIPGDPVLVILGLRSIAGEHSGAAGGAASR